MIKQQALHRGKAKTIYATDNNDLVIVEFRDDITAFNKVKEAQLTDKGMINNQFNAFMMELLESAGIRTHFKELLNKTESLVQKVDIIPVEWVIRNRAAGNIAKRYGLKEGEVFPAPIIECFYKNDALGDPWLNDDHILIFGWATRDELTKIKALCLQINQLLVPFFAKANLILVDYKLEFGRAGNEIILADEISPDGCRIWDVKTLEKLDKDRFRLDLGDVLKGYLEIASRLNIPITV